MYLATIRRLNYREQESKTHFVVYDSDTPVTLTQCQGHQTWNEVIYPNQGYNHEKFERPPFNGVREKVNVKVCQINTHTHVNYLP